MSGEAPMYRDPEDLTDSEEEVHPNVCARSYHRFRREERRRRLEALRARGASGGLTPEEAREKNELEYKFLPIAREVPEGSFKIAQEEEPADYSEELLWLLNHRDVDCFIQLLDEKNVNMDSFEDLVYCNLSSAIREGEDDLGREFCRLGLLVRWAKAYGRGYLCKIKNMGEDRLAEVYSSQYEESKRAIARLDKE